MAPGDLTTLAYVQAYMSDATAATAAVLPQLITGASLYAANYCSRNFYVTSYTEDYNGSGNSQLLLRQTPVISVSSVVMLGQSIPQSPNSNAYGWVSYSQGLYLRGGFFSRTVKGITVAYSAGFAASAATMPADLQECIAIMCNIRVKRIAQEDKSSVNMMQQSTVFVSSELTPFVKQILSQYQPKYIAPQ